MSTPTTSADPTPAQGAAARAARRPDHDRDYEMPRSQQIANLMAVVLPFVAFLVAIYAGWNAWVDGIDLAIFAFMYVITGFGVTIGFHRLLTHRGFTAPKWVEYSLAIAGSMSIQGPVTSWVADHRKHHAFTDAEGDPHSPHVGHGSGLKGLIHAHVGWIMTDQGSAQRSKYAKDLVEDRGMRRISKNFELIALASLLIPAVLGFALHGFTLEGFLRGLLWGGFVRIFLLHHITWSINSICHFHGKRRFDIDDHSTNVAWLAVPSLGEAWHHNHHAFPRAAVHGMGRREIDITGWVIAGMEKVGLARDVVRISPERQAAKELRPS
ncbi:acyl-CoA desaturase [Paraconexibacter algicola]|nr:acyl-CoA desaturase [Paraconexibacter algicola]